MKAFFELIIHLFYRYYNNGSTKAIAYESALIAVSALLFLNVFAVLMFFNLDTNWVSKIEENYGKIVKLISGLILIIPQYVILKCFLKKEDVIKKQIDSNKIRKWNVLLISYIVFSVLLLILSIKMK